MFSQFFILSIVFPGSVWSPLLDFQETILKDISQLINIGANMLFWQDGSFLGRATQIDPCTISGYMLSLLAMLLRWLMTFGKNNVSGVGGKVGSMLCKLSIVAHCIPRVYVIPIFGFAGTHFFKQENIDPEMVCWEFLGLGVISLSNRSLYHSRVCVIPTCNATTGVFCVFFKGPC